MDNMSVCIVLCDTNNGCLMHVKIMFIYEFRIFRTRKNNIFSETNYIYCKISNYMTDDTGQYHY